VDDGMRMRMQKVTCLSKVLGGGDLRLLCADWPSGSAGLNGGWHRGLDWRDWRDWLCVRGMDWKKQKIRWRALLNVGKVR